MENYTLIAWHNRISLDRYKAICMIMTMRACKEHKLKNSFIWLVPEITKYL